MTLKINDSGTWKEPTKVSVKDGGAWKEVLTASVKDGGSWKPFYQRKYTYTVSSDVNKLDLDAVLSSDNKLGDVDVIINSGVYVIQIRLAHLLYLLEMVLLVFLLLLTMAIFMVLEGQEVVEVLLLLMVRLAVMVAQL